MQQINFTPSTSGTYDLQVLLHGSASANVADKYALAFSAGSAVACFCAGTRILTPSGEVAVEQLAPGDRVVTAAGRIAPVRFVGRRRMQAARAVRVQRDAVADGAPLRDLLLSPEHAIAFMADAQRVLVPVHRLLNGASIIEEPPANLVYYHVELDRHDVILAEGLTVESYLDTGNRAGFDNAGPVRLLHPEAADAQRIWAERGCAELLLSGPRLRALHERIRLRAGPPTADPDLAALLRGCRLHAADSAPGRARFLLPPDTSDLILASRSFLPRDLDPDATDPRRLGVAVTALVHAGAPLPRPTDAGWHRPEAAGAAAWQWTDGQARLTLRRIPGPATLECFWIPELGRYRDDCKRSTDAGLRMPRVR